MTPWKDRVIKIKKGDIVVAEVLARKVDALIYQWANDLLSEEELKGQKPEEYISKQLDLEFVLPASALHQIAFGIQKLKKEHQNQIAESGREQKDFTNSDLSLPVEEDKPEASKPSQDIPEEKKVTPGELLIVRTPEEAASLCKIAFMVVFLLHGTNDEWAMNVLTLAGYDRDEIKIQMERKKEVEAIERERLINSIRKGY